MQLPHPLRRLLDIALAAIAFGVIPAAAGEVARRSPPPNVILILTDDWGIGKVQPYGMGVPGLVRTPNLDRLARDGVTFTRAYAGSAVCAPSRACLLSGQHSGHCGIRKNTGRAGHAVLAPLWPPAKGTTLGEIAQQAGYLTACFGKIGTGTITSVEEMNTQGWDYWEGFLDHMRAYNYYPNYVWRNGRKQVLERNNTPEMRATFGTEFAESKAICDALGDYRKVWRVMGDKGTFSDDYFTDQVMGFIKEAATGDKPFFVYFASQVPHGGPPGMSVPDLCGYETEARLTPKAKVYAAAMTHHDRNVGRIRGLLEDLGLGENTLIIWSSDNGDESAYYGGDWEMFKGTGPFRGHKRLLYEGGIRVPTLAVWPGRIAPGSRSDFLWAAYDLVPTMAEIGGLPKLPTMDGISMLPVLQGHPEQAEPREHLYYEFYEVGKQQAVVFQDWKAYRLNGLAGKVELYNLADDIGETNDLAAAHPEIVRRVEQIMRQEHRPHPLDKLPGDPAAGP